MQKKGLSILIPVYNHNVIKLIEALNQEAKTLDIPFEIRCYDDASDKEFRKKNRELKKLKNVVYKELEENIGRSKIRNLLAQESEFKDLLFIDGDSKVNSGSYLNKYVFAAFSHDVLIGGTTYSSKLSNPEYILRWKYGRQREELSAEDRNKKPFVNFTLNNLFISRNIYLTYQLDENITTYGHEDTKFGFMLKNGNVQIRHIDNPVEHVGLETNEEFLTKTEASVKNLYKLSKQNFGLESKLFLYYRFLKRFSLNKIFNSVYGLFSKRIEKNLNSHHPHLFFFDLYKLNLMLIESQRKKASRQAA